VGYSFDADPDQIELINYPRFSSSDEVRHSTEYTNDDAVITLASGQSIELQHVHVAAPTEHSFKFDQTPVLDSAAAMTIGNGAVMAPSGTIHNIGIAALNAADDRAEQRLIEHGPTLEHGGRIVPSHSDKINSATSSIVTMNNEDHKALIAKNADSTNAHVHTIDAGSNVVVNSGVLKALESDGNHSTSSEASEHGAAPVHGAAALGLGDSFHFKGEISGFEGSDVIDLAEVDHIPASISHRENPAGTGGPEEPQTIELSLPSQHSADHVPHHAGGAVVAHMPHDLIV